MFYVRGNHDEIYKDDPPGGIDLHGKVVEYKGLTLAGLEGSIRYNAGEIQYTQMQMHGMVCAPRRQNTLESRDWQPRRRSLCHPFAGA